MSSKLVEMTSALAAAAVDRLVGWGGWKNQSTAFNICINRLIKNKNFPAKGPVISIALNYEMIFLVLTDNRE